MNEILQNLPANVLGRLAVVNTIRNENTWKEEAAKQKSFDMSSAIRNELHSSPNNFLTVRASHIHRYWPKSRSIWKLFWKWTLKLNTLKILQFTWNVYGYNY